MIDKAKLVADMDTASTEFLAKVEGVAMVSLIAGKDGSLMLDQFGEGMVTDIQMQALDAATILLMEVAQRAGISLEIDVLRNTEGQDHGKRVRLN